MRTIDELLGPAHFVGPNDWEPRSRPLTSRNGDVFLVPHHSVSRTLGAILAEFDSPARTLSATSAIGPLRAGEDAYQSRHCVAWNTGRPYTTSSSVDDKAITFEMANLALTPPWPVGQTGKQWVAELAAAMHVELGMPLDRWHVACHSEIYERGWGSYPTACCGDDLRSALDWVVEEAIRIVNGVEPEKEKEDAMKIISDGTGAQKFADEFGVDDIGSFFFLPNGPNGSPSWVDNIYGAWLLAGEPQPGRDNSWDLELARHQGNARWDGKRGQIVTDVVAALKPLFAELASAVAGVTPERFEELIEAGLANVVIPVPELSDADAEKLAKVVADEQAKRLGNG